jgi:monoamine oxidase
MVGAVAAGGVGPWGSGAAPSEQADIVIIGAGAAGISAARRLAAMGRPYVLLEASSRVGGRAVTDMQTFGVPFDMGAHWIHMPGLHPLSRLGKKAGFDIYRAPDEPRLFINGREGSDGEYAAFDDALERAEQAITAAGSAARDVPASNVLPKLGSWGDTAELVVGPLSCAKELNHVSTLDFARSEEEDVDDFCRQGFGALIAHLAAPLSVHLDTQVTAVDLRAREVVVETSRGTLRCGAVIVAIPPSMLVQERLRILPEPTAGHRAAIEGISLGAYDHIAFLLPKNPFDLKADELVFFRSDGRLGCALLGRIGGTDLHSIEVGGDVAMELARSPAAAEAFAREVITRECGRSVARGIAEVHATAWTREPFALGAFSCAEPGAAHLRHVLAEPVDNRLFFAGEHTHEGLWGTVGGAWLSGERAAKQAVRAIAPKSGLPMA